MRSCPVPRMQAEAIKFKAMNPVRECKDRMNSMKIAAVGVLSMASLLSGCGGGENGGDSSTRTNSSGAGNQTAAGPTTSAFSTHPHDDGLAVTYTSGRSCNSISLKEGLTLSDCGATETLTGGAQLSEVQTTETINAVDFGL